MEHEPPSYPKLTPMRVLAHFTAWLTSSVFIAIIVPRLAEPHSRSQLGMLFGLMYGLFLHFPLVNWLTSSHEDNTTNE